MSDSYYYNEAISGVGIPYDDIRWYDIEGTPFGLASGFNVIVFGDANNIVDVEGAMAVGGNYYSPRGLSVGFERENGRIEVGYSPDLVRFMVGGDTTLMGPLVVVGHVVGDGRFNVAKGSTYLIGKDGMTNQKQELAYLYQAAGGSRYWEPADKENHYLISSYDVPRYIPAERIQADVNGFFSNARDSVEAFKSCIEELPVNGTITDNYHEWVLRGNNPTQNVFQIDARPNGLITKGIRAEVPEGSLVIVRILSGDHAHLQYGVMGEESKANHTLYVFEDAQHIHMEQPSDIWGSILAPQAMFHGHQTGGHVSGSVALGSFAVNANSGFEFHLYPFVGGVVCGSAQPQPTPPVQPMPTMPVPTPPVQTMPTMPTPPVQPMPTMPTRPTPPVQTMPTMPRPTPPVQTMPTMPTRPIPPVQTMPTMPTRPTPPVQTMPTMPRPTPPRPTVPRPTPTPPAHTMPAMTCPECPACPETEPEIIPFPVPVPVPVPIPSEPRECPVCPDTKDCLITPGIIFGCVWGCDCSKSHEWDVKLYSVCNDYKNLLYCETISRYGCFKFEVPYDACYVLEVCPSNKSAMCSGCKPKVTLKNIGVANFMIC
ncbi:choice-of-anchor A family protein [Anaerocolumna xylanovorans]|uniref:Choice-of-anchor A domain-containing protein n=1 Tax=Anaerocolumna xylanovorans DSM 12503 TaxID=1121345 RepID=A0A1M7YGL0_9FIRM|nr:choice-of-anchor A family protein [Anaerocolumna xylanovorans]SHO51733.1 choice-of-anchor A domain-containing protein [Anaerocolumna xylanovorans DSM 12503]